jgi:hypothetical protein
MPSAWLARELTVARVAGSRPRLIHAARTGSLTSHTAATTHSRTAAVQNDVVNPKHTTLTTIPATTTNAMRSTP